MRDTVRPASLKEKPLIKNLLQPYLHELSEYGNIKPNRLGEYEYRYLDCYWKEKGRYPYLIFHGRKVAGFVLVRKAGDCYHMAEFFILRPYRRSGLGRWAASQVSRKHKGKWRIEFFNANIPAEKFWKIVASDNADDEVKQRKSGKTRIYLEFWTKDAG
ncbi:MAG: GNAT family N-acetyltransferase [Dehalococcoidales bacterium]|nr:GNAT family N-acetyltransferase [Dehalococcoidales bacterium]